ncbi:hypothetical protein VTJ49DRAFT_7542 [Mycothermus thermophilus]|uniref:Uncharacterized protein n=1 Tax=Humicola insolens TaxID=85995 RepID=A0ABR3VH43_HUMIN
MAYSKTHPGRDITLDWDTTTDVVILNYPVTPAPKVIITLPPDDPIVRDGLVDGLEVRFRLEEYYEDRNMSQYLDGRDEVEREDTVAVDGTLTIVFVGEELRIRKLGNFNLFAEFPCPLEYPRRQHYLARIQLLRERDDGEYELAPRSVLRGHPFVMGISVQENSRGKQEVEFAWDDLRITRPGSYMFRVTFYFR